MNFEYPISGRPQRGKGKMETVTTRAGEPETKLSRREAILRDFVRFSWRATRGLTTAAETEGRELIRRMTETGRITPDEEERLLKGLLGRMNASRRSFEERVGASIQQAVDRIHEISTRELASLETQISSVERRVTELWSRKRGK
jgi:polyhydroxyalkanoate synthesis regulator phasin